MLTPGHRNEFIDCHRAKVHIVVQSIMAGQTRRNLTLESVERVYQLQEFIRDWLQNPTYGDYRPRLTTQDEWTIVKYVREVWRPFRHSTLSMSKLETVTLLHIITLYNDMCHHMDGVMRDSARKITQWKDDLSIAVKLA